MSLRIGVLASVAHRTPPRDYGPWEQVASTLAEGLHALGHEVTLFATTDSSTAGRLVSTAPTGYEEDATLDAKVVECLHTASAFERADEFDVLSNQFDFLPLTYSRLVRTPVVTTVHGFSSEEVVEVYRAYDDVARYVSISDADRHADLGYEATIHHGVDLASFTYREQPADHLLFLGRIHPHKGTHLAIEVARRAGLPLVIAGIVQDRDYFEALVRPHLSGDVSYVGSVGPHERDALLGSARALLHLISFDEPFGLSVVEAMATGTPVVAFGRGSLPELVVHGVTGFLVDSVADAVRAVGRPVDRGACRAHVEQHFTAQRMVARYDDLLERVVHGGQPPVSRANRAGTSTIAKRTESSLAP